MTRADLFALLCAAASLGVNHARLVETILAHSLLRQGVVRSVVRLY